MAMLETPSRILRRIEALEEQNSDLPSLPSFPDFDDSAAVQSSSQSSQGDKSYSLLLEDVKNGEDEVPYQSTPAPLSSHATRAVVHPVATPAQGTPGTPNDLNTPYKRRRSFLLSLVHSSARPRMALPTPHPHARAAPMSRPKIHPLSQAWSPSPAHLDTPGLQPNSSSSRSPDDRLSFISTASSHDLTLHPRANASFDPVTGAKGVGRFNAVRLNTYLHGLNRRLQEENETLMVQLKMRGEEIELDKMADHLERDDLDGVEKAVWDEVAAMRDALEKCENEKDAMKMETDALVASLRQQMDDTNNELEAEREERTRDNERYKERMAEVERGVDEVIKELERRLGDAERDAKSKTRVEEMVLELEAKCLAVEKDLEVAIRRAEQAEDALATSSDLEGEAKLAYERAAAHQEMAIELEKKVKEAEEYSQVLEAELATNQQQVSQLLVENLERKADLERQERRAASAAQAARQMEEALEDSEKKMIADEQELASLRTKITRLERELEALRERSQSAASFDESALRTEERARQETVIAELETELDNALVEIGRLNHLVSQSPTRKAIDKARDMRIELLEKERDELTAHIRTLTSTLSASLSGKAGINQDEGFPTSRRALVCRTPKMPGTPLKDLSWLVEKSVIPNTGPLVAQIEHLKHELYLANHSIDRKMDQLEDAGIGVVGLTEKLKDAQARAAALEEQNRHHLQELLKAQSFVSDLEDALKVERSRLRALSSDQSRLVDEKKGILLQLQRARSDMEEIKTQLEKAKRDNGELEAELRATANMDQKSRLLEAKVAENQTIMERLRSEKEILAADHAALQGRYTEASAQIGRLRQELSTTQVSHNECQRQLDRQANKVEELCQELSEQARELERVESEKDEAQVERSGIIRTLTSLESDLKQVRSDAEAIGRDLKELKVERDRSHVRHRDELEKVSRAQKQLSAQLRLANEQLEAQRERHRKAVVDVNNHVCQSQDVDGIRTQHKHECKGLMVQIRYLKAKFTRESAFREDLAYQKWYLLGILSSIEKSDERILAAITCMGFPLSRNKPSGRPRRLRIIAVVVLFITRARRTSEIWRDQSAPKTSVQAALQEVRRCRVTGTLEHT